MTHPNSHVAYVFKNFISDVLKDSDHYSLTKYDETFFWKKESKDTKSKDEILKIFTKEKVILIDFVYMIMHLPDVKLDYINVIEYFEKTFFSNEVSELLNYLQIDINESGLFDDYKRDKKDEFEIRFFNCGDSIRITEINHEHKDKIVTVKGMPIIRGKELFFYPIQKKWECTGCGITITQIIQDRKREPKKFDRRCKNLIKHETDSSKDFMCNNNKWIDLGVKKYKDVFSMKIESLPEDTKNKLDPSTLNLEFIDGYSKEHFIQSILMFYPYEFTGIIKMMEIKKQDQVFYISYMDVMSYQLLKPRKAFVELTDERRFKIKSFLANKDSLDKAGDLFGTRVVGFEREKKAFILMRLLQVHFNKNPNLKARNFLLHMLLCGDYGRGKSELAECFQDICDNPYYVTASTTTGVGLSGSTVKDEITGQFGVQAGAYAKASGDVLILEEFDKSRDKGDLGVLNEGMSKFKFTVAKANQYRTFKANTIVVMVANPKHKSFNLHDSIFEQINIAGDLLSRFAFISAVLRPQDVEHDIKINKMILKQRSPEMTKIDRENAIFLRECIEVASNVHIDISKSRIVDEELEKLQRTIDVLTKKYETQDTQFFRHFTPRNISYLSALIQAVSMWHCHDKVTIDDVNEARNLYFDFLKEFKEYPLLLNMQEVLMGQSIEDVKRNMEVTEETVEWEIKKEQKKDTKKGKIDLLIEFIKKTENTVANGLVSFFEIEKFAKTQLLLEGREFEDLLKKLKNGGDIYEPKRGYFKVIKTGV